MPWEKCSHTTQRMYAPNTAMDTSILYRWHVISWNVVFITMFLSSISPLKIVTVDCFLTFMSSPRIFVFVCAYICVVLDSKCKTYLLSPRNILMFLIDDQLLEFNESYWVVCNLFKYFLQWFSMLVFHLIRIIHTEKKRQKKKICGKWFTTRTTTAKSIM